MAVAAPIHSHSGRIDLNLSAAPAHCPRSEAIAYHTIAAASSH